MFQNPLNKNKKGFTLVELLMIVAIVGLLATVVLVSISQSRKNARINAAKTSLQSALPAIIACMDGGGDVNVPIPIGGANICNPANAGLAGAKWPLLSYNYEYIDGERYNYADCRFQVSTNGDSVDPLNCSCANQTCS